MAEYEVSITAPYDNTVTVSVMEESLPIWLGVGWQRTSEVAPAPASAPAPAPAPEPAPAPQPSSSTTPAPSGSAAPSKS